MNTDNIIDFKLEYCYTLPGFEEKQALFLLYKFTLFFLYK